MILNPQRYNIVGSRKTVFNAELSRVFETQAVPATVSAGEGTAPSRVNILAYTGGLVRLEAAPLPVVFDLASTKAAPNVTMLYGHDRSKPIGHFDSIKISATAINQSGLLSIDNQWSQEVKNAAKNSFPWQASVGIISDNVEYVAEGTSVTVNGQSFRGPIFVARQNLLRETSILPIGADPNTTVTFSATLGDVMNFANWLKAINVLEASLTADQRAKLQTTFDTMMAAGYTAEAQSIAASAAKTITASAPTVPPVVPPVPPTVPPVAPTALDANAAAAFMASYRSQMAAEHERVDAINRLAVQYNNPTIEVNGTNVSLSAHAIRENWPVDRVELTMLRSARPTGVGNQPSRIAGISPWAVMEAALAQSVRADERTDRRDGLLDLYTPQVLDAAHRQYRGRLSLQQMLYEAAVINGYTGSVNVRANVRGILQAAFSTLEITGILANTANKSLLDGYNAVDATWRQIATIGSVADFKEVTHWQGYGNFTFEKIAADGMIPHATMGEASYGNKAETYAKMFAITRQDIYNDDLNVFGRVPRMLGRGGAIKLNKVFWTEFLDNTGSFWSGGHANQSTGVLGIAGLQAATTPFLAQTDENGDFILAAPKYLLVPNGLMPLAMQLFRDTQVTNGTTTPTPNSNPWAGKYTPVTTPYLTDSTITGNSSVKYYLLADPNDIPTIEVVFLEGKQTPTVETADVDFNQLGIQMRGFWDWGVRKQNYRGSVQSSGA